MIGETIQNQVLRICCLLVLVACAVLQLQVAVVKQLSFSGNGNKITREKYRGAGPLTHKAKELYLFEADMDRALHLLQTALQINPLYVPAWLGLTELYNDMGSKDQAFAALNYADLLTADLNKWRWDKALVAYQIGSMEMLPSELHYIIQNVPGKSRNDALQLAFSLWDSPDELLLNVGVENGLHLLNYAVRIKEPDKALFFWKSIEEDSESWQEDNLLALLNMLINTDKIEDAKPIWRKYFAGDDIIYNGDFSKPFLRRAFGWRLGKNKGFDQRLEPNSDQIPGNSIYYRFKGWENINFHHLTQIVPVQSGLKYELSVDMRAVKMTTNQRPLFEVYGYKCSPFRVNTKMVEPNQDWEKHTVIFGVPEDCSAVVVRLRRYESNQIDNKLSGKIWVRNISIERTGEDFTVFEMVEQ